MRGRGDPRAPLFEVLARLPARRDELGHIVPGLDGELLVSQAARHGLAGSVADALAGVGVSLKPAAHRALAQHAQQQLAAGARHRRFTLAVVDALAREGVVPVLLKGYGLARRLYEKPLLRAASDVDVLVAPSELAAVARALAPLGLRSSVDPGLTDVLAEGQHVSFGGAAGLVEAHFRLVTAPSSSALDAQPLLARAQAGELDGRPVRFLAAEDELLSLAVHAANHAFLRVSWLVDLERFLAAHRGLDWPLMRSRAAGLGVARAFEVALDVVARTLEVALPPDALDARTRVPPWRRLDARLFTARRLASASVAQGRISSVLVRLWLADGPPFALRQLRDGARRWRRRRREEARR